MSADRKNFSNTDLHRILNEKISNVKAPDEISFYTKLIQLDEIIKLFPQADDTPFKKRLRNLLLYLLFSDLNKETMSNFNYTIDKTISTLEFMQEYKIAKREKDKEQQITTTYEAPRQSGP